MTEPTQSQIEAAMNAYDLFLVSLKRGGIALNPDNRRQAMLLALTAAAQVGEYQKLGIDPANPNPDGSDYHLMNVVDDKMLIAATIERCAQVADDYSNIAFRPIHAPSRKRIISCDEGNILARAIAAAIRGLKDEA